MELWIRSQDRERLTITNDLRICYVKEKDMWAIEDCDYLGFYKTKERALEVLDEIDSGLWYNHHMDGTYQDLDIAVKSVIASSMVKHYQMPKE